MLVSRLVLICEYADNIENVMQILPGKNFYIVLKIVCAMILFLLCWTFLSLMHEEVMNDTISWSSEYLHFSSFYSIAVSYMIPIILFTCVLSVILIDNTRLKISLSIVSIIVAIFWYYGMLLYPVNAAHSQERRFIGEEKVLLPAPHQ